MQESMRYSGLRYLNAIIHHEESFGMTIDSEEWNAFQIFEDDDFQAFLQYLSVGPMIKQKKGISHARWNRYRRLVRLPCKRDF